MTAVLAIYAMLTSVGIAYIAWKLSRVVQERNDYRESNEKLLLSNASMMNQQGSNGAQLTKYRKMVAKYEDYIIGTASPDELDAILNGVLSHEDSDSLFLSSSTRTPDKSGSN